MSPLLPAETRQVRFREHRSRRGRGDVCMCRPRPGSVVCLVAYILCHGDGSGEANYRIESCSYSCFCRSPSPSRRSQARLFFRTRTTFFAAVARRYSTSCCHKTCKRTTGLLVREKRYGPISLFDKLAVGIEAAPGCESVYYLVQQLWQPFLLAMREARIARHYCIITSARTTLIQGL